MTIPSKDFNAPADNEIDVDSPGNETLWTKTRDALIHLEEWMGKNYTAAVDHDHNGVNSKSLGLTGLVGQGELKTSSGIVSTTASSANLTMPGAAYGFYPQFRETGDGMSAVLVTQVSQIGSAFITNVAMGIVSTGTALAQQRYITASAPFNLGNGDIPIFVFALIDNITGEVVATYTSDTPPWFYNGRPENTFDARKYKRKKNKKNYFYDRQLPFPVLSELGWDKYYSAIMAGPQYEEIEITPEAKNLDMDIIPHPFMANDLTGKSVVLLNPVGSMAEKMRDLHDMGECVADLLHGRYLLIDNEEVDAISPIGVKTHKVQWK